MREKKSSHESDTHAHWIDRHSVTVSVYRWPLQFLHWDRTKSNLFLSRFSGIQFQHDHTKSVRDLMKVNEILNFVHVTSPRSHFHTFVVLIPKNKKRNESYRNACNEQNWMIWFFDFGTSISLSLFCLDFSLNLHSHSHINHRSKRMDDDCP